MDKMPKLERNIPAPPSRRIRRDGWIDLLRSMKVGDSFIIEDPIDVQPIRESMSHANKRTDMKSRFTTRTVIENGKRKVRVWRVE